MQDNPYEAPKVPVERRPGGDKGSRAFRWLRIGLGAYALFEAASAPLAVMASGRLDQVVARQVAMERLGAGAVDESLPAAERAFHDLAGSFHLLRAIADVGLLVGFAAGLVWLHGAWARARRHSKEPSLSPGAVVLWSLVPVWGLWRLHGFLLRVAKWTDAGPEVRRIDRWWGIFVLHIVVRLATTRMLGWGSVLDSLLAVTAAILGIRMVTALQGALERRREEAT